MKKSSASTGQRCRPQRWSTRERLRMLVEEAEIDRMMELALKANRNPRYVDEGSFHQRTGPCERCWGMAYSYLE